MAPSPVGSLGSPAVPYGLAEQMQHLSMDPSSHPQQQQVPSNVARYQLDDRPLNATSPPPAAVTPQQSPNAAYSSLPQQAPAQLYQPTAAAAVAGSPAQQQQQQQAEDDPQAAAEAWARYHREKEEYDAYIASQAVLQGAAPAPAV